MEIAVPDGNRIEVEGWAQGELGITLTGMTFDSDIRGRRPEMLPLATDPTPDLGLAKSAASGSGTFQDYQLLAGAATALANPGSVAMPMLPEPYAPASSAPVVKAFDPSFLGKDPWAMAYDTASLPWSPLDWVYAHVALA